MPSPLLAMVLTISGFQAPSGRSASAEHRAQLAAYLVGPVAVGLVDHVDVADLEDPRLRGLDAVAHARRDQHQRGVGHRGDLDLALPDAHGLDQDHVAAGGLEHAQRLRRRPREPAEVATRGHRADVDLLVERVVLHPHPVTEQGAAGERRGRVHGEHADPLVLLAQRGHQRGGGGGLADPGRAGEADDVAVAGVRRQAGHHLAQQRRGVLDQRDQPRDRARVPRAGLLDQLGDVTRRPPAHPAPLAAETDSPSERTRSNTQSRVRTLGLSGKPASLRKQAP